MSFRPGDEPPLPFPPEFREGDANVNILFLVGVLGVPTAGVDVEDPVNPLTPPAGLAPTPCFTPLPLDPLPNAPLPPGAFVGVLGT
jgi:hypothetical protein